MLFYVEFPMISILTDKAKWIFHELMFFLFVWNICFSMDKTLEGAIAIHKELSKRCSNLFLYTDLNIDLRCLPLVCALWNCEYTLMQK